MINIKKLILSITLYILIVISAFIIMVCFGAFIFWQSPFAVTEFILSAMFSGADPILIRVMILGKIAVSTTFIWLFYKLDFFEMMGFIKEEEKEKVELYPDSKYY